MTPSEKLRRMRAMQPNYGGWLTDECEPTIEHIKSIERQAVRHLLNLALFNLSPWIFGGLLLAVALGRCS